MNKFSVVTCTDGNYLIRSEHSSKEQAFKAFHSLCAALWNDDSFTTAMVKVLDENLDCVEGKMELILKTPNEVEEEQEEQLAEE